MDHCQKTISHPPRSCSLLNFSSQYSSINQKISTRLRNYSLGVSPIRRGTKLPICQADLHHGYRRLGPNTDLRNWTSYAKRSGEYMVSSRKLVNYSVHLVIGSTREGLKSEFSRLANTVQYILYCYHQIRIVTQTPLNFSFVMTGIQTPNTRYKENDGSILSRFRPLYVQALSALSSPPVFSLQCPLPTQKSSVILYILKLFDKDTILLLRSIK